MSISSIMLVSLVAAIAAIETGRFWVRGRLTALQKTRQHWDQFVSACKVVLAMDPRSPELLELVAFANRLLRRKNGAGYVAAVLVWRGVRYIIGRNQPAGKPSPMSTDEASLYMDIFVNAFELLACQHPIPGILIRMWLKRLRKGGKASAGPRATSLSADVHSLGHFTGGNFNPA